VSGYIVAVDSVSPTVFCISETGDLIRWFDCSDYMREPSDIAVSGKEYFVCDFKVRSPKPRRQTIDKVGQFRLPIKSANKNLSSVMPEWAEFVCL